MKPSFPLPPQLGDWPETAKAVQEKYPETDLIFIEKLAIKCAGVHANIATPACPFSDQLMADAIRQVQSPNQNSAGLYLTTIPNIVAAWTRNGHAKPAAPHEETIAERKARDAADRADLIRRGVIKARPGEVV